MRRKSFWKVRWTVLALLVLSSVLPLIAQDEEDDESRDDGPKMAWLNVFARENGKTTVSFSNFGPITDLGATQSALASSTGCPAASFVHPPADYSSLRYARTPKERARFSEAARKASEHQLTSSCSSLAARASLLTTIRIDANPLLTLLKQEQVDKLWVYIHHPRQGSSKHSQQYVNELFGVTDYQTSFLIPVQTAGDTVLDVSYGYTSRDLLGMGGMLFALMVVPIAICYWIRAKALRLGTSDPTAAWFSYFRAVNLCVNGVFLFWMISGFDTRRGMNGIIDLLAGSHSILAMALSILLTILPPWIVYFVCLSGSYQVLVRIRGIQWRYREFLIDQFLTVGSLLLPIMLLVSCIQLWRKSSAVGLALLVLAYVSRIFCARLKTKLNKTQPEPVSTGELRDRIFAMAQRAGVELKHIFLMPAGKMQIANAYAASNGVVMFTDYVLQRLSKREVDAVAAHELTHLQHKHPVKLTFTFLLVVFMPGIATVLLSSAFGTMASLLRLSAGSTLWAKTFLLLSGFWGSQYASPVMLALGLLLFFFVSRRFERQADAGSVLLTNDPEAMITGLLRLNRLNLMPFRWGKATGLLLTHPSTLKRIHRIAKVGNVPEERIQQIMSEMTAAGGTTDDPSQHYAVPTVAQNQVVTTAAQLRKSQSNFVLLILGHLAPPMLFAYIALRTSFGISHSQLVYAAGAVASLVLYVLLQRVLSVAGRDKLRKNFEAKFRREGLLIDYDRARMVGFSPGPYPRFYLASYNWDNGFLILRRGMLVFLGDKLRFRIPLESLDEAWLGQGKPGWWGDQRLYIRWRDSSQCSRIFSISPGDSCSAFSGNKPNQELARAIQDWRENQSAYANPSDEFSAISTPTLGEVTSMSPKALSAPQRMLSTTILFAFFGYMISLASGLHCTTYILLTICVLRLYELIPYWRYKDPVVPTEWHTNPAPLAKPVENPA